MARHIQAYLIVISICFIPGLFLDPKGVWYFVSIACWSWISAVVYISFIRLRCATLLAAIEIIISVCATIAYIQYAYKMKNGYFYTNLESIFDILIALEVLVITISMIGTLIGFLGNSGYNNRNRPHSSNGANPC